MIILFLILLSTQKLPSEFSKGRHGGFSETLWEETWTVTLVELKGVIWVKFPKQKEDSFEEIASFCS